MRRSALIWPVLVAAVLIASGCKPPAPPPVTVTAVVKPPPSGGGRGTVVLRFSTSPGWNVVIGENDPLVIEDSAPDGIVFSPASPAEPLAKSPRDRYGALPRHDDPQKVFLYYQVRDKRAVPADVALSMRYIRYSPDDDQGQFGHTDLVVRIPK